MTIVNGHGDSRQHLLAPWLTMRCNLASMFRWFLLFACWNATALMLFVSTHEFMEAPGFDLPLVVFLSGLIGYVLLRKPVMQGAPGPVGQLPSWAQGFHLILWAEALMEAVVFTLIDFHDTPANDPFFMAFWACMLAWFIGGWPWLARRQARA